MNVLLCIRLFGYIRLQLGVHNLFISIVNIETNQMGCELRYAICECKTLFSSFELSPYVLTLTTNAIQHIIILKYHN